MKHIKVFETTSAMSAWMASHTGVNPYAYFCLDSGITYYQNYLNSNGHAFVDLGLPSGTLWATMNLGASSVDDIGSLYAWGERWTKQTYTDENYDFYVDSGSDYSKYNSTDHKQKLDLDDDAARFHWGGSWVIPNSEHFHELLQYTYYTNYQVLVETINGTVCCIFTSGINGNTITLPLIANSQAGSGSEWANYWTCDVSEYYTTSAQTLNLYPGDDLYFIDSTSDCSRSLGLPIRPIMGDRNFERPVQEK